MEHNTGRAGLTASLWQPPDLNQVPVATMEPMKNLKAEKEAVNAAVAGLPASKLVKLPKQATPHQDMLEKLKELDYSTYTLDEYQYMYMKARNLALQKTMYEEAKIEVRYDLDNDPDKFFGVGSATSNRIKERVGMGEMNRYMYFTINISPENWNNIGAIDLALAKCTKKVWIKRWMANYEQRGVIGSDAFGTGIHVNLLVEKTQEKMSKRLSECEKEMKNTWKHLCRVEIAGVLTVRYAPSATNFENYLRGIKEDINKTPLVEADRKWRRDILNRDDLYGTWDDVINQENK